MSLSAAAGAWTPGGQTPTCSPHGPCAHGRVWILLMRTPPRRDLVSLRPLEGPSLQTRHSPAPEVRTPANVPCGDPILPTEQGE